MIHRGSTAVETEFVILPGETVPVVTVAASGVRGRSQNWVREMAVDV